MNDTQWEFLTELLETPSPSGYETRGQRVWLEYVEAFADEVHTDDYGNAVAVYEGDPDAPEVAVTGHADEIGFIVNRIDDDGFVHLARIGGSDRTVSKGQHVTVHSAEGPVPGVIGQTAIHLREHDGDEFADIDEQTVDIGAGDGETARETVSVGDPITFSSGVESLMGSRVAARGLDNRVGTWAAAEGLRRAAEAGVDATVYAVSTVQEEVGARGAKMVSDQITPDAVLVVDVTHTPDHPGGKTELTGDLSLGDGPTVGRGGSNHPVVAQAVRKAAADEDLDVQIRADASASGTDARSFYTAQGGIPTVNIGVPNRYMHTPVEVVDTEDLDALGDLLAAFADQSVEYETFAVDV